MSTAGPARPGPALTGLTDTASGALWNRSHPQYWRLAGPWDPPDGVASPGAGEDPERLHPSLILRRPALGRIHQPRSWRLVAASGRPDRLAPDREPAGLRSPPWQHPDPDPDPVRPSRPPVRSHLFRGAGRGHSRLAGGLVRAQRPLPLHRGGGCLLAASRQLPGRGIGATRIAVHLRHARSIRVLGARVTNLRDALFPDPDIAIRARSFCFGPSVVPLGYPDQAAYLGGQSPALARPPYKAFSTRNSKAGAWPTLQPAVINPLRMSARPTLPRTERSWHRLSRHDLAIVSCTGRVGLGAVAMRRADLRGVRRLPRGQRALSPGHPRWVVPIAVPRAMYSGT